MSEPDHAETLPDDAIVVRGGRNQPDNFATGSGVSLADLTAPNRATGYPGIPHRRVGVTTAGAIRAAGGEVVPSPTWANPCHATLSGLTPNRASELFRPTIPNPSRGEFSPERT